MKKSVNIIYLTLPFFHDFMYYISELIIIIQERSCSYLFFVLLNDLKYILELPNHRDVKEKS